MIQEQLVDYISSQIKLGVSQDAIKSTLVGAGWAAADVDDTFKKINGGVTTAAQPAKAMATSPVVSAAKPADKAPDTTIRVSDLVSASSASAISVSSPATQAKVSPMMGSVKPVTAAAPTTAATKPMSNMMTPPSQPGRGGMIMTIVWIVLVVVFAGLAGYFFFENMSLSSQVGSANTQSQGVSTQVSTLQSQIDALTASSTAMGTQISSLTMQNQNLNGELMFFVVPSGTIATTTNVTMSGIVSVNKSVYMLSADDGVNVTIKNSADPKAKAALQPFASTSKEVQIMGTYVIGTPLVTVTAVDGNALYPPVSSTPATTTPTTQPAAAAPSPVPMTPSSTPTSPSLPPKPIPAPTPATTTTP